MATAGSPYSGMDGAEKTVRHHFSTSDRSVNRGQEGRERRRLARVHPVEEQEEALAQYEALPEPVEEPVEEPVQEFAVENMDCGTLWM